MGCAIPHSANGNAVSYLLSVLPMFIQPVALAIRATRVFDGMRTVLAGQGFSMYHLISAFALNLLCWILADSFLRIIFGVARKKRLLAKLATR